MNDEERTRAFGLFPPASPVTLVEWCDPLEVEVKADRWRGTFEATERVLVGRIAIGPLDIVMRHVSEVRADYGNRCIRMGAPMMFEHVEARYLRTRRGHPAVMHLRAGEVLHIDLMLYDTARPAKPNLVIQIEGLS
jgi:hypothetical protein